MTVAVPIATGLLISAGGFCLWGLFRGRSLAELTVSLELLLVVVVLGLGLHAAWSGQGTYLDTMLATTLLGFVGTTAVARFIERQGGPE